MVLLCTRSNFLQIKRFVVILLIFFVIFTRLKLVLTVAKDFFDVECVKCKNLYSIVFNL